MKKFFYLITLCVTCAIFTSCGLYSRYESNANVSADLFGKDKQMVDASAENSIAELSWRDFFVDPLLRQLIDTALLHNVDVNSARIAVEQSQVSLKAAKLANLPSLTLAPTYSISSFGGSSAVKSYNIPLQIDWQVDVFGSLSNQKRQANAIVEQNKAMQEVVYANVVSSVAQQYSMLQLLDKQLEILIATEKLWAASLETQKSLWENGKAYSTAVNQMEASYINVKTQIVDTKRDIHMVENSICALLAITPQHVSRSKWEDYQLPQRIGTGVPAQLLANRADIKAAERAMEAAFYNTNAARAAFYPNIILSGAAGWTDNAGGVVIDPGKILLNAVASLVQPIFARGKVSANYKLSQLTQEELQHKYIQTVINAGNQVNEAMAECQASKEKCELYQQQVDALQAAYDGTHELMNNGKASYLEVLTAQEALLQSQLNRAMNLYEGRQALVALYVALGGASK